LVAHGPLEPRILVRVQAPEPLFFRSSIQSYAAVRRDFRPGCDARSSCFPVFNKYFSARSSSCSSSRGDTARFRDNRREETRRAGLLRGGIGFLQAEPARNRSWSRTISGATVFSIGVTVKERERSQLSPLPRANSILGSSSVPPAGCNLL
jgi:hypothetical protein